MISVAGTSSQKRPKVSQDANVVIRVDKISPDFFTTYLNGDLIATTKAYKGHKIDKVGIFYAGGINLAIFDSGDREMAEVFAEAMRNSTPNDLETREMERKRQAMDGSEIIAPVPDYEMPLEVREEVAGREKEAACREREVACREREVADREKEAACRKKEVADREKEVAGREKEAACRKKEVACREREVADREKEVAGREKLALEKEKTLEVKEKALERRYND